MHIGPDILLRVGLAVFGVLLLRDGYAGLQGRKLGILKGVWFILDGWKSQLAGAFFILAGALFLILAWFGVA
jgi:hypothetical protein